MKGTVLEKIVQDKAIWVEARQQQQPLSTFQHSIEPASRHFYRVYPGV
jgi:indole-3-glycerol phosphate synthase/phosphoribosylanthranilate isomerase